MGTTKVTRDFRITLPKDVRKAANIKIGDTLNVVADDKGARIMKTSAREAIMNIAGSFKEIKDSAAYVRAMRERWKERPRL
ncbi:AbrB/MazE/SpoVT family DNA-binding domain-containing protein [Candidatus Woesearchaeota archaeon]|nr:AbrB/MazE/SpoVT family DNA-binding domain-containing protein [Candidatus Woesearchaeota archaeon]